MGIYTVELSINARTHLQNIHKSGDKQLIKKIEKVFVELANHPTTGVGRPKILRHSGEVWARRLDQKNRICYKINDTTISVVVLSALGHYGDK